VVFGDCYTSKRENFTDLIVACSARYGIPVKEQRKLIGDKTGEPILW